MMIIHFSRGMRWIVGFFITVYSYEIIHHNGKPLPRSLPANHGETAVLLQCGHINYSAHRLWVVVLRLQAFSVMRMQVTMMVWLCTCQFFECIC